MKRVGAVDPQRADLALAAFATATLLLEAFTVDLDGRDRLTTALAGLLAIPFALSWRRRNTLLAAGWFAVVVLAQEVADSALVATITTPLVVALLLFYSVGRHLDGGSSWLGFGLMLAAIWGALALDPDTDAAGDILFTGFLLVPVWLVGRTLRGRALLQRELRAKADLLDATREESVRRAAEEERVRIASELQALVAEGISAIVVQAEAVPRALAGGDTPGASNALALIEDTGRESLAEMRRLLGVLRRDGARPELEPQPSLARLEALLSRAREDGLEVVLACEGQVRALSPGADLAAYRVLQEALAGAAAAGAGGRVAVTITYGDSSVALSVSDERPAGGGPDAATVAALRERVGLYGGTLRGRRRRDGSGMLVSAELPYSEVAA